MRKNPSDTFDILKAEYLKPDCSHGAKPALLSALDRTDDKDILQRLATFDLAVLPSGESIASSDMSWPIYSMGNHSIGKYIQWEYVKNNWTDVVAKMGSVAVLDRLLRYILGGFSSRANLTDFDDFFRNKYTEGFAKALKKCKDEIQSRASYRERDAASLKQWLMDNGYIN